MTTKKYRGVLTKQRLTIPELSKEERRWNMFLSKLKNNKAFVLQKEGEVTISNPDEIINAITDKNGNLKMDNVIQFLKPNNRYAPVIKTDNGEYKLNQFHKTIEFGGGAGTSLGTINARTYETIQALFFSLRQYLGRDIGPGDIYLLYDETSETSDIDPNYQDIKAEIYRHVKSRKPISRDDFKFFEDKGWIYTYIKTANEFYNSLNSNKHYTFHHAYSGDGIADAVYRAFVHVFHRINKENKVRINMSRWNPSDIWAVETDMEQDIISSLRDAVDLTQLNTIMDSMFDSNFLVGISLKKIPVEREIELIVSKTLQTNFIYSNASASEGAFETMTVHINAKSFSWLGQKRKETLDARIYSGKEFANMFLEIRGSASKYGKASLNFVNSILNRVNVAPIPSHQELEKMTVEELRAMIIKLYANLPHLEQTANTSIGNNISNIKSKLVSKCQALLFVSTLEKYKNRPQQKGLWGRLRFLFNRKLNVTNYIIKEIFYYAYSMGGELFENTKFYRIRTQQ